MNFVHEIPKARVRTFNSPGALVDVVRKRQHVFTFGFGPLNKQLSVFCRRDDQAVGILEKRMVLTDVPAHPRERDEAVPREHTHVRWIGTAGPGPEPANPHA